MNISNDSLFLRYCSLTNCNIHFENIDENDASGFIKFSHPSLGDQYGRASMDRIYAIMTILNGRERAFNTMPLTFTATVHTQEYLDNCHYENLANHVKYLYLARNVRQLDRIIAQKNVAIERNIKKKKWVKVVTIILKLFSACLFDYTEWMISKKQYKEVYDKVRNSSMCVEGLTTHKYSHLFSFPKCEADKQTLTHAIEKFVEESGKNGEQLQEYIAINAEGVNLADEKLSFSELVKAKPIPGVTSAGLDAFLKGYILDDNPHAFVPLTGEDAIWEGV